MSNIPVNLSKDKMINCPSEVTNIGQFRRIILNKIFPEDESMILVGRKNTTQDKLNAAFQSKAKDKLPWMERTAFEKGTYFLKWINMGYPYF